MQILEACGFQCGDREELRRADAHNLWGYYELPSVIRFNSEAMHKALGMEWKGLKNDWELLPNPEQVHALFCYRVLKDLIPRGNRVAVKDPRFCLTLGLWARQLLDHDVRLIYCARGEEETAKSWHKAYGVPADKALELIRERQHALERWIDLYGIPHEVVLYENWFENPLYNALKISHLIDQPLSSHVLGVVKDRADFEKQHTNP
jgi:hypothetical protein